MISFLDQLRWAAVRATVSMQRAKSHMAVSVSKHTVLNVHRNHEAYQGRGERVWGVWRWGEREIIYLSLHCHHQSDSCIKVGSDENYFNVSLIVRDKVTDHNF